MTPAASSRVRNFRSDPTHPLRGSGYPGVSSTQPLPLQALSGSDAGQLGKARSGGTAPLPVGAGNPGRAGRARLLRGTARSELARWLGRKKLPSRAVGLPCHWKPTSDLKWEMKSRNLFLNQFLEMSGPRGRRNESSPIPGSEVESSSSSAVCVFIT